MLSIRHKFCLLITLIILFAATVCQAEQVQRTLKVGWCLVPGYQEYDEKLDKSNGSGADTPGVYSGYSYDYLKSIASYTGWQYQFVNLPKNQLLDALENGQIDIVALMTKTPERQARFLYPDTNMGNSSFCLVSSNEDDRFSYGDYKSLNNIRIGVNRFSVQPKILKRFSDSYGFTPEVVEYDSYEAVIAALKDKKVDAIIINLPNEVGDYKILMATADIDFYFITNKKNQELCNGINSAILQIKYFQPDFDDLLDKKFFPNSASVSFAFSKDEEKYLSAVKTLGQTLVVQFDPAWEPIEYKDKETGEMKGIMADVFAIISKETGLKFKFVTADSYANAVLSLGKSADLAATLNSDLEWADIHNAFVTQPVFDVSILNLSNSETGKANIIALPKDYHLSKAVQNRLKNQKDTQYKFYDTMGQCVDAVRNGEVGSTYINAYELNYYTNMGKIANLKVQSASNFSEPTSIGIAKNAPPQLRSIMAKALRHIPQGQMEDIIIKNTRLQARSSLNISDFVYAHPREMTGLAAIIAFLAGSAIISYYKKRELEQQRQALEVANNAKSEFLNRVSHDIRTPMNAIIGLTEIAKTENQVPTIDGYLNDIDSSSKYLLSLIDDILDMSKIEKGSLILHPGVLTPQNFVDTANSTIAILAKQAEVKFTMNFEGNTVPVYVDTMRYKQIFINLLDNGVKHTAPGKEVNFTVICTSLADNKLHMKNIVTDHGDGISPEFLPHIFESFTQEDSDLNRNLPGSGLGLAIVKRLVELMGGTIAVTSTKGKGTVFTVEMDVPIATEKQIQEARELGQKNFNAAIFDKTRKPDLTDLQGKRVLAAEDNLINQKVIGKLLAGAGMTFDLVNNGQECVDKFSASPEHHYDVILMDIRMPVMDGMEATKQIRQLSRSDSQIPIVALTADAIDDTKQKSQYAGMNAFLTKPVYPQNLYRVLKELL